VLDIETPPETLGWFEEQAKFFKASLMVPKKAGHPELGYHVNGNHYRALILMSFLPIAAAHSPTISDASSACYWVHGR
jgi:hypothetical protein